jgi:6,7-dimethyl-8-ribityllumazine synthase
MSDRYETPRWDDEFEELGRTAVGGQGDVEADADGAEEAIDLDASSENVLDGWPATTEPVVTTADPDEELEPGPDAEPEIEHDAEADPGPVDLSADPVEAPAPLADHVSSSSEHAPGELTVPPGYSVLEGQPAGERRSVGIVVARFNGDVTSALLQSALDELETRGVARDAITVMPVPGAFELPLAAMALAKTRRFACVVALGCVIRGDTPHFEYVSSEAASGLQLAGIETGVPVAFGVLTLDRADQAESRYEKGAEAVRTGLEMADVFANLRAAAAR